MNWLDFETITMKSYNGKTLYLKATESNKCDWTFDKQEAIWFPTLSEAKEFAERYFKNFKGWSTKTVTPAVSLF